MLGLRALLQPTFATPRREDRPARLAGAVDWTPTTKFDRELTLRASSWEPRRLFEVAPLHGGYIGLATDEHMAVSPSGRWCYVEKVVPRGERLEIASGKRRGNVMFDGPALAPALHQWSDWAERWSPEPWMSITPMEMLTLRPGTRKAKGRVVVAGLGLGHQLVEVSHRRQVTSLVLVERDAELVEWLVPRLAPHLGMPVEVIVGDAYKVMPLLTADIALVDIFPRYGGNSWECRRLARNCPHIKATWCWGA